MKKVLLIQNNTTYVYNLRREVLRRLIAEGCEVTVVAQKEKFSDELAAIGCRLIDLPTDRHGKNPLSDLVLYRRYYAIIKKCRPDVVLTYNIKPNVYGGLACQRLRVAYIANITGLGTAVEYPGALQKLTCLLYRLGIRKAKHVFLQNEGNFDFCREKKILTPAARCSVLPGSGVNLEEHPAQPYPEGPVVRFLFIARIMKEKGIGIFLEAAQSIHKKYPNTEFDICGGCDDPDYVKIMDDLADTPFIHYHGEQKNVNDFFKSCHCFVLPSYYPEGMSNVLLEAAAAARPIITTSRAGCRETVDDGITGFVIPTKDTAALEQAMEKILTMSSEKRKAMGAAGREKMERQFDRGIVVDEYWKHIRE